MWVFGYGSLMWDEWEKSQGCLRRLSAELAGYRRVFNKASVKYWGSNQNPGPTLNLERSESRSCRGLAFEFPYGQRAKLLKYLRDRELGFELRDLQVTVESVGDVEAMTPIYNGKHLLTSVSLSETASAVLRARGTKGTCSSYVQNIAQELVKLDIDDPAVAELSRAVREAQDK